MSDRSQQQKQQEQSQQQQQQGRQLEDLQNSAPTPGGTEEIKGGEIKRINVTGLGGVER